MAGGVAESMDPLAQLWDDEEGQEEEEEDDENEESAAHEEEQGPTRKELRFEDIQAKGYESGPSVMGIPEERGDPQPHWRWGSGRERRGERAEMEASEGAEEGDRAREAANEGAEELAARAMRVAERARTEKEALKKQEKLTHNQREKRKRSKGAMEPTTVEEEKRAARNLGVYSGFDS